MSRFVRLSRPLLIACAVLVIPMMAAAQVTPDMRAQGMALAKICRADFNHLCNGVIPGGGRVLACLQSHAAALSQPCRDALPQAQSLRTKADQAGVLPK